MFATTGEGGASKAARPHPARHGAQEPSLGREQAPPILRPEQKPNCERATGRSQQPPVNPEGPLPGTQTRTLACTCGQLEQRLWDRGGGAHGGGRLLHVHQEVRLLLQHEGLGDLSGQAKEAPGSEFPSPVG